MPKTSRKTVEKHLKCTKCGNIQSIRRILGRNKASNHIKHLWCYICKGILPHEELP